MQERHNGLRHLLRANHLWLLLLVSLCLAFFAPVLFFGRIFYGLNTSYYYYPDATLTATAWNNGELPLWDPRVMFGYPYFADPHAAAFYPLSLIFLLLPFPLAYNVFVVSHVLLLGLFFFLLLQEWKLSPPSSAFGAAVLMFCGFTVSSAADLTTLLRGLCWLPLALLWFTRYLATGHSRYVLLTGLTLAVQGSGTDPQFELFTGTWLVVAGWLCPTNPRPTSRTVFAGLLASYALAACLLAYQYIPLAELASRSDRRSGLTASEIAGFEVDPRNLYNLVLPTPFPNAANPFFFAGYHGGGLPFYVDIYCGFVILALAAASFSLRHTGPPHVGSPPESGVALSHARMACVAALVGVIGLLLSLGSHAPVFSWLTTVIPPLASFRYPAKYLLLTAFSIAVCSSAGFHGLLRPGTNHWNTLRLLLSYAVGVALFFLVVTTRHGWSAYFLGLDAEQARSMSAVLEVLSQGWRTASIHALLVTVLALTTCILVYRRYIGNQSGMALLATVTLLDLAATTFYSLPLADAVTVTAAPPIVHLLPHPQSAAPPPRLLTVMPMPDYGPDYTVYDQLSDTTQLMLGMQSAMHSFGSMIGYMSVRLEMQTRLTHVLRSLPPTLQEKVLAAVGVSHILRKQPRGVSSEWDANTHRLGPVLLKRLSNVSPRAFVASRATPLRSSDEAGVTTKALLALPEEAFFASDHGSATPLAPALVRTCRITNYARHRVQIDFDLDGHGLLVLLDTKYPGWQARVDGRDREIHTVAGLFRGVAVSGGERTLEFTYRPASFVYGALISLTTLLFVLLSLLRGVRRRWNALAEPQ